MKNGLSGHFAKHMTEMMEIKRNSGFSLDYMHAHIAEFDVFSREKYPDKHRLDQELVQAWIYSTNNGSRRGLNRRIRTMRHLANHLTALGLPAYLCPIRIKIPKSPAPHILTDEQLTEFFRVSDSLEAFPSSPCWHIIFPVMFRLLYCCGLRNSEACNLKCGDINLINGAIKVIGSKGHKDRVVYMAPDLLELCVKYDAAMETLLPGREYFFASYRRGNYLKNPYLHSGAMNPYFTP